MGKKRLASMMAVGVLLLAGFAPAGAGQVPSVQVNGMMTEAIPELVQGRAYLPRWGPRRSGRARMCACSVMNGKLPCR